MRSQVPRLAVLSVLALLSTFAYATGASAADTNLIGNPSLETAASSTRPSGWTSDYWGTTTSTFSYATTGHTGSRSIRVETTSYTSGDAKWYYATAIPVVAGTTYQFTDWYQSDVETEIDAEITMSDGTLTYAGLATLDASTTWAQATAQYTIPAGATNIIVYHTLAAEGYLATDDYSLIAHTPTGFDRALVSLTFDDGWRSQYTNGLPLLEQYGMNATFYALTSTTSYPAYMTTTMMQTLATSGNEVASHTVTHPDLTTLTVSEIDAELADSQTSLRQWVGSSAANNFASPYGAYDATVDTEIAKYYRSHRTVDEGYNSKDNFDIYHIVVQNVLNTTTPEQVGEWVDEAIADQTWLVLVYHEVDTGLTDPTYSVTPSDLGTELSLIQSKGVTVATVDEALDEIEGQLS